MRRFRWWWRDHIALPLVRWMQRAAFWLDLHSAVRFDSNDPRWHALELTDEEADAMLAALDE